MMYQNNMGMNQNGMFPLMHNQMGQHPNFNFNPNFPPGMNFRPPFNNHMMPNVNNNMRFPVQNHNLNPNPVMFNIFNIKGGQNPFPQGNPNLLRLPFLPNQLQQRLPMSNNNFVGRMNSGPINPNSGSNMPSEQIEDIISKLLMQQNKNNNGGTNNNSQDKKNDTFENSTIQEVKGVFEEEYSLEAENLKNLWSG
jgi:hypothetical protein